MAWNGSNTWIGVQDSLRDAFTVIATGLGLDATQVDWEDSSTSGDARADPRLDLWINNINDLGLESTLNDYDSESDTMITTVEGYHRIVLTVKATGDEGNIDTSNLITQVRRQMRTRLDIETALRAVGLALNVVLPTIPAPSPVIGERVYTVLITDFVFFYLEREVDSMSGTPDWFDQVTLSFTTTVGPPSMGDPMIPTTTQINPLAIPLQVGNWRLKVRGYSETDTGSLVVWEAEYICTRTVSNVYCNIVGTAKTSETGPVHTGVSWTVAQTVVNPAVVFTASPNVSPWLWFWQYTVTSLSTT